MTVGVMFLGLVVTGFILPLIAPSVSPRAGILWASALQGVFLFILPSWLAITMAGKKVMKFWGLETIPSGICLAGVVLLLLVSMPAMNQIIYWNETMTLPDAWGALEATLRNWEENAAQSTATLLDDSSWGGLVSGILIIGILTGFAEESFFRGLILPALSKTGLGTGWAVWVTAAIFSAFHFQFFGFIPRLLLGALFGYLFVWSGTLWTSVFAHALNNSIVVFSGWLMARGYIGMGSDEFGVSQTGVSWLGALSVIVTFLVFYLWRNKWSSKKDYGKEGFPG